LGFRSITPRAIFEDVYVPLPPQDAQTTRPSLERALRVLDPYTARRPRPMERRAPTPRPDHHYSSSPGRQVPTWSG
jgi:hypothetical protein